MDCNTPLERDFGNGLTRSVQAKDVQITAKTTWSETRRLAAGLPFRRDQRHFTRVLPRSGALHEVVSAGRITSSGLGFALLVVLAAADTPVAT